MTVARKNYYKILGVTEDADSTAIRRAYRRLVLQYHPDRAGGVTGSARFLEIQEAYSELSDPARRQQYDRARVTLESRAQPVSRAAQPSRVVVRLVVDLG